MDEDFVMDICGELSSQSHLLGLRPQAEMEVFSYGQQVAEGRAVKSLGENVLAALVWGGGDDLRPYIERLAQALYGRSWEKRLSGVEKLYRKKLEPHTGDVHTREMFNRAVKGPLRGHVGSIRRGR